MNRQTLIALMLAVVAALLAYYYLTEKEMEIKADVTPMKVLMAKKSIPRGGTLSEDKVSLAEIPGAYVMPGAIASNTQEGVLALWRKIQGQFVVVPIAVGEQILPNKLSKLLPGFAGVVPEGKRIMTLNLDPAAAVGGNVKPGNYVDILGTFEYQFKGAKRMTAVALAQNVLVAAVGDETAATPKTNPASRGLASTGDSLAVSLAILPEDAVRLALAEGEGKLKLMLRPLGDDQTLDLPDQNLGTVLGPLMKVRQEEIEPAKKQIQIIRGLQ